MFLLEGMPSVIAGIVTCFYLTDKPEAGEVADRRANATWCTTTWRATGSRSAHREHSLLASLKDGRIWLLILIFFCIIAANSSLTFYGPTLVKEVGFTSPVAVGWIMAAAYLCGAAGMILNGMHSDQHQEGALPLRAGGRAGRRIAAGDRDLS